MTNETKKIIRHEWSQILVMIIALAGIFLWCRSESKEDYRHMEANMNTQILAIQTEMKDFHGRLERQDAEFKANLLVLEEKFKNKG